jgi:DNA-binding response OmpR family regulator
LTNHHWAGWTVTTAANAQQAINVMGDINPCVILLDINLPDMNGFALTQRLKDLSAAHCKIIAVSGQEIDRQTLATSVFDNYQLKPLDMAAINRLLP